MLVSALYQRIVICCDIRYFRIIGRVTVRATDANDRLVGAGQRALDIHIIKVGDNAIATPFMNVFEPAGKVFLQIQIPVYFGRLQIMAYALYYLSVIHFISIKQQRNAVFSFKHIPVLLLSLLLIIVISSFIIIF